MLSGVLPPAVAHRRLDTLFPVLRRAGHVVGIADLLNDRACLYRSEGRYAEALAEHRPAIEAARECRDRQVMTEFRCDHARTLQLSGDVAGARAEYRRALAEAVEARAVLDRPRRGRPRHLLRPGRTGGRPAPRAGV